jgi:hypothetical protein
VLHHLPTPKPPQQHQRPRRRSPPSTNRVSMDRTVLFNRPRTVNQLDLLRTLVWSLNQILYRVVDSVWTIHL